MAEIQIGSIAPDFTQTSTNNTPFTLSDNKGKNIVLYFYPKDSTPGCTTEGQGFRDNKAAFDKANTLILGVSRDSIKRHENFIAKQSFNFDLISDEDETVCTLYDVIKPKKLYGKEYIGIERSTFLIDSNGIIKQIWRKVKVKGHIEEILQAANNL